MEIVKFNNNLKEIVKRAVEVLKDGGLVIYPTETSYGVGVDASNSDAVDRLLKYKNRPEGKPISVAVISEEMATEYVEISENAKKIYDSLLPGPVTVVSKSKSMIDKRLESEDGKLGIRWPDHVIPLNIIKELGKPVTSTSANLAGLKTPYKIEDILETLTSSKVEMIGLIIDYGELPHNPPSTVVDTTLADLNIIRSGGVTFSQNMRKYESNYIDDTFKLAAELVDTNIIPLREKGLVFLLDGDLGAGKTHFAKGLGKAINLEDIDSPTYSIMNEIDYSKDDFKGQFIHIDTWRLERLDDLKLLKIEEYLKPGNIVVVEWWSKFQGFFEEIIKKAKIRSVKILIENQKEKRIFKVEESSNE